MSVKASFTPLFPQTNWRALSDDVISALKTVYDPENPRRYFSKLGLIYKIDIEDDRMVKIAMTLTRPRLAPFAGENAGMGGKCRQFPSKGVSGVEVSMTFDPPWTPGPHVGRGAGCGRLVLIAY